MGDRSNIVIQQAKGCPPLCIYGHWLGSGHVDAVVQAIGRGVRWTDPAYLARIIFGHALGNQKPTEETGFGLSVGDLCDNEHPVLYVDIPRRMIAIMLPADGRSLYNGGKWVRKHWKAARVVRFECIESLPLAWEELYKERYPEDAE